jgi:hypothetical protein
MADKLIPNLQEELKTYLNDLKQELIEKFTSNDLIQQVVKVGDRFERFQERIKGFAIVGGLLYLLLFILLIYLIYLVNMKK